MKPAARVDDSICHGGNIQQGSDNVKINNKAAALAGKSQARCNLHFIGSKVVSSGSGSVFINNQKAARQGDSIDCGATISAGSDNVLIGG